VYNFKDKLTRPTQGQGVNHKAMAKEENFKLVLKDRPRPRPRTNITGIVVIVLTWK